MSPLHIKGIDMQQLCNTSKAKTHSNLQQNDLQSHLMELVTDAHLLLCHLSATPSISQTIQHDISVYRT